MMILGQFSFFFVPVQVKGKASVKSDSVLYHTGKAIQAKLL